MLSEIELVSEKLERAALESLHEFCPNDARDALGLKLIRIEDVSLALSSAAPSILINRALGLGTETQASAQTIIQVAETYRRLGYRRHGLGSFFFHVYEDDLSGDAVAALEELGLVRRRGWMKFHRDAAAPREIETDLRVEMAADQETALHFGRIVCSAFGMPDLAIPKMAGINDDPRWHLFVSYDGDTPTGAGGLFVEGSNGWLEWGATDEAFRRRGSHGAIMAARIGLAAELDCENLFTETGEAVEGDPQHSYRNILKSGFTELKLRANYAPSA